MVSTANCERHDTCVNVICTLHFIDYIKSCFDKCTPFIICYLIQFILKIVQHVSNHVTVHPHVLNYLLHQLSTYIRWVDTNSVNCVEFWKLYELLHARHLFASGIYIVVYHSTQLAAFYIPNIYILMSTVRLFF